VDSPRNVRGVLIARIAADGDQPHALRVWRSANAARGLLASPERVRRVDEKLNDASALLVVIADDEQLVGMALAEPFKDHDGAGPVMPGAGHISMMFVDPDRWGEGLGGHLLRALHVEMCGATWVKASLWTRVSNERARRLYSRSGYVLTGDTKRLPTGDEIIRYEALLTQLPQ
jgi:ribosomal protein S18 acetylase RimI-like enzyme